MGTQGEVVELGSIYTAPDDFGDSGLPTSMIFLGGEQGIATLFERL